MTDLKNNKSFRVLVGAFCIYIAFRLWRDGWFSSYSDSDGYGNAELVLAGERRDDHEQFRDHGI